MHIFNMGKTKENKKKKKNLCNTLSTMRPSDMEERRTYLAQV